MYHFKIAETQSFLKVKSKLNEKLYVKLVENIYPQLQSNPFYGANIKKLKGKFEGYYRYRVGSYRLFYVVENEKVLVVIVDFRHRKDAYM